MSQSNPWHIKASYSCDLQETLYASVSRERKQTTTILASRKNVLTLVCASDAYKVVLASRKNYLLVSYLRSLPKCFPFAPKLCRPPPEPNCWLPPMNTVSQALSIVTTVPATTGICHWRADRSVLSSRSASCHIWRLAAHQLVDLLISHTTQSNYKPSSKFCCQKSKAGT